MSETNNLANDDSNRTPLIKFHIKTYNVTENEFEWGQCNMVWV